MNIFKIFKKIPAIAVAFIILPLAINIYAADQISIIINGKSFQAHDALGNEISPIIYNDRTYLPLRAIGEAFGKAVDWDGNTNTVFIGDKGDVVYPYSDEVRVVIDGGIFVYTDENNIQVKPIIVNGTTYLPLRGAGLAFGKQIGWSPADRTVYITDKNEPTSPPEQVEGSDLRSTIISNITNYNTEGIDISKFNVSGDELKSLVTEIVNLPEFYYVSSTFMYSETEGKVTRMKFEYDIDQSIVLQAREAAARGEYKIFFVGDWDVITDSTYKSRLEKVFYDVYPRLVKRWGDKDISTAVVLKADKNFNMGEDVVGFTHGYLISFSTKYANNNPDDMGFFAHELTHAAQQYGDFDTAWWTENMANYGRFRYYHWAGDDLWNLDYYSPNVRNWGYEPYGECMWFFAYLDSKYPTVKNADGSLSYGLIDKINNEIKAGNIKSDGGKTCSDDNFNAVVFNITGFKNIDDLREQYIKDLNNKSWVFSGFAGYRDNFITENIPGTAKPKYNRP